MIEGFLVLPNQTLLPDETNIYMRLRESIGYQNTWPHLLILEEDGRTRLKNTELGLVETRDEAGHLLELLEETLPDYDWRIERRTYPDADKINWYRVEEG